MAEDMVTKLGSKIATLSEEMETLKGEVRAAEKVSREIKQDAEARLRGNQEIIDKKITRLVEIQGAIKTLTEMNGESPATSA